MSISQFSGFMEERARAKMAAAQGRINQNIIFWKAFGDDARASRPTDRRRRDLKAAAKAVIQ